MMKDTPKFFIPKELHEKLPKELVEEIEDKEWVYRGDDLESSVTKEEQRNDFKIGCSSQKETALTLICKICGSDSFMVGTAAYYTAIKCKKCKYEFCTHEG